MTQPARSSSLRAVPSEFLFTSESVTEGHPDKVADQVSDTVLDAVLADDPAGRVACETLITTGLVVVAGEISTETYVDIPAKVRAKIAEIGYTHSEWGFDGPTHAVSWSRSTSSLRTSHRVLTPPTRCSTTRVATTRSTVSARATRG